MRYLSVAIFVLTFVCGCTPYPRYRSGSLESDSRRPDQNRNRRTSQNQPGTRDLNEMGRIIQGYLGTPYRGRSHSEKGLDCSEFVQRVYDEFGNIQLPRTAEKQFQVGYAVRKSQLRYGDLVFFNTGRSSPSHVGIYVGYSEFAHASSSSGVIISSLKEKYWSRRYLGARRILP